MDIEEEKLRKYLRRFAKKKGYIDNIYLYESNEYNANNPAYYLIFVVNDISIARNDNTFPYDSLIPIHDELYACAPRVSWGAFTVEKSEYKNIESDPISDFIDIETKLVLYEKQETHQKTIEQKNEEVDTVHNITASLMGKIGGRKNKKNPILTEVIQQYMRSNKHYSFGAIWTHMKKYDSTNRLKVKSGDLYADGKQILTETKDKKIKGFKQSTIKRYIIDIKNEFKNCHS